LTFRPPFPRAAQGTDVLVSNFNIQAHLLHSVGVDSRGQFIVHHTGTCKECTLELHK